MKIYLSKTEPKHIVVWVSHQDYAQTYSLLWDLVSEGRYIERKRVLDGFEMYFGIGYLEKLLLCVPFSHLSPEIEQLMIAAETKRLKGINIKPFPIKGLQRPLFDYQYIAVKKLIDEEIQLLNDEMGLAKTAATIAALKIKNWFPALIAVGSVAGKYVWEREAAIMFPKLRVQVVEGTKAQRAQQLRSACQFDITIINVQALRIRTWDEFSQSEPDEWGDTELVRVHKEEMANPDLFCIDWECFVCDEYHRVNNSETQQAKGFLRLDCGRFIGLSGTPIIARPEQAWTFLHKCDPEMFPTFYHFEQQIGKFTKSGRLIGYDPKEMLKIKNWLAIHSLRRRKEHVSDQLPEVIRVDQIVEMGNDQRKIYKRVKEDFELQMEDGSIRNVFDARVHILRLKQACFSPELFGGSNKSGKITQIKEDVAQLVASGEKCIVFSEWSKAARILQRELSEYNPAYVDGSIKPRDRVIEQDKFNNDENCHIYIGTIGANAEAITLNAATYVLFSDEHWTPATNFQAEARSAAGGMRGLGVVGKVTIIRYQAEDTIEQRLAEKLWKKTKRVNAFIERDAGSTMQKLTIKSLRELI